jgi:dihydrofolate reductase
MKKLIASIFVSLDGVMQAPGGPQEDPTGGFRWGGWAATHWDDVMNTTMEKIRSAPYDLLLGRRTYEIFAANWPYQKDDPTTELFNRIHKYVVATSLVDLSWQHSSLITGDVVAELRKLKSEPGPDLFVDGSGKLLQTLLTYDLVDQLHIWTFPLVLGSGKRLFEHGVPAKAWRLTGSEVSKTGVLIGSYEPGGEVKTGSLISEDASDAELHRRERFSEKGYL